MISLYFHIPFCYKKCNYCSFYIFPTSKIKNIEEYKDKYLEALKADILYQLEKFKPSKNVYTIYFWWGTPSEFWISRIENLAYFLQKHFDFNNLQEVSFEINPLINENSIKDTISFVKKLKDIFPKLRISIWIQSINNKLLKLTGRNYSFETINNLLENFPNVITNLDFISFWLESFFDKSYFEKFENFVKKYSPKVHSYSVYMLELFPGSIFENSDKLNKLVWFNDNIEDKIYENFKNYTKILQKNNYQRYEISNFSKPSYESKHNIVYWQLWSYLWFWTSASWFIKNKLIRYTNTYGIQNYINKKFSFYEFKKLSYKEFLQEKVFLWLRTTNWILLTKEIETILDISKLNRLIDENYIVKSNSHIKLTSKGFDVYNYIITEILDFN